MSRGLLMFLCLSVALGSVSGCAYYNTFFHAQEFYNDAVKRQENADERDTANDQRRGRGQSHELYNKCIAKCDKLAERFPNSKWRDDASLLKAKAYYGKKDYLGARNELLRFISRYPDSELLPQVYYHLGLTYYRSGNHDSAREAWAVLTEQFPDAPENKEVSYYLAESHREQGNLEEAEAAYATYIESQGRSKEAYRGRLERATMRLEAGDTEGAREDLLIVGRDGRTEQQRLRANLLLAQVAEAEGNLEAALEIYWGLAYDLDSNYRKGRLTAEERQVRDQKLNDDAVNKGVSMAAMEQQYFAEVRKQLDPRSWEYESLALVLLSEGEVQAKMGHIEEAVLAFEQVIDEYRKSPFAAEAQYRIAYSYEVYEEDLAKAEQAYKLVSTHGRSSFSEDAVRRAGKLNQVKNLAAALGDSTAQHDSEEAKARFLRAELFLFQQDRPAKAVEEYESIQRDFAGTDYEGKAALAEAYVRLNIQKDPARGRAALADVMRRFGDTEYGVYARRILKGPDPEPEPEDFAGPGLDVLLAEANLARMAHRDSLLQASAEPKPRRDFSAGNLLGGRRGTEPQTQARDLLAVPPAGSSPILSAWDREPRVARNRLSRGFPSNMKSLNRGDPASGGERNSENREP